VKHVRPFAFYGDDFTGSTDALEFLCRSGLKAVLFIDPPSSAQLEAFGDLDAIGVAGLTRSMAPNEMERVLRRHFEQLKSLGFALLHYKVCSTFDSSPTIGSIGKVLALGLEMFDGNYIPIIAGSPHLGRYCLFGNLFARMGIGSEAPVFRVDRHPVMMHHPVTPSQEADLCLHLAQQCVNGQKLANLDQLHLSDEKKGRDKLNNLIADGTDAVVMDGLTMQDLRVAGELIAPAADGKQRLVIGSSGVEVALGLHWERQCTFLPITTWPKPHNAGPILVISGSCSPVTEAQINHALFSGFAEVEVRTDHLLMGEAKRAEEMQRCCAKALHFLNAGQDVIVHTARGKNDARIAQTRRMVQQQGIDADAFDKSSGERFGCVLGGIASACLQEFPLERMIVVGGDSSSYAARTLGVEAVEMICPLVPGAPLCRVIASKEGKLDGLEVNFKGGQVGRETYFTEIKNGRLAGLDADLKDSEPCQR